ncbi:MAG: hypothetical protein ACYDFU_05055, partial [Nitrospirota bacterium]
MGIFRTFKNLVKTYLAQRSGIPLKEFIEATAKILLPHAPQGKAPYNLSILPDGKTEVTEIEWPEKDISDKQALEYNMGTIYSHALQHKAVRIIEETSFHEADVKGLVERIKENKEQQAVLLDGTPDYHYHKRKYRGNKLAFLLFVVGETGAMSIIFADLFGLDPMKLTSEIYKHPISFFITLTLSISFFGATLKIAEQTLHTKKKTWIAGLLFIAVLIGAVRAIQSAALGETDISVLFLSLLFTTISFVLPIVAASFAIKSKEASDIVHLVDSKFRRLREQEWLYQNELSKARQERQLAQGQLDGIVQEYVSHYQKWRAERAKSHAEWERFMRYVEAYLSTVRLWYLFFCGRRSRETAVARPIKRLAQIAGMLLAAIMFFPIGCSGAHAEDAFNVMVIGDRSSSAGEYSCTPEALEKAGQFWVQRADERGGGTFEVFIIDKGFDSTTILFSETYPQSFAGPVSVNKKRYREEFFR